MPNNQLLLQALNVEPQQLESARIARSVDLATVQYAFTFQGDDAAPHFTPENNPVADGRAYQSQDGDFHYRPQVRVATGSSGQPGPQVRFLKDAQGKVSLHFEVEEEPPVGMPAGAMPFNIHVESLALLWQPNHQFDFDLPLLVPHAEATDSSGVHFTIRVGADIPTARVDELYGALSDPQATASLQINLSMGYWVDPNPLPPDPHPWKDPPIYIIPHPGPPVDPRMAPIHIGPVFRPDVVVPRNVLADMNVRAEPLLMQRFSALAAVPANFNVVASPAASPVFAAHPVSASSMVAINAMSPETARLITAINQDGLNEMINIGRRQRARPNFRSVTLVRTVPFTFRPDLDQNRPIYAALKSEALKETFQASPHGVIARAPFPNTVYCLPDQVRLAYNTRLAMPYFVPTIYRDDTGAPRVRVTLGAIPWLDPQRVVDLRDWLLQDSVGALAAPNVVIGGYKEARFELTTAFPENIQVVGADSASVNLAAGFELVLDLSLEFYKFLCELLTGPPGGGAVGLSGRVSITADIPPTTAGGPPVEQTWHIPMNLNLQEIAALPVDVQVATDTVSPTQVTLVNQARADMRIEGCVPRLLQEDRNLLVPVGVFGATTTTAFPTPLPAGGTLTVTVEPEAAAKGQLWTAIEVQLLRQSLVQSPQQLLDHIHEVAPSGTLDWVITVECPPFAVASLPPQFQNLFKVDAKIMRAGFADQRVTLSRSQPSAQVHMQRTLRDLLSANSTDIQSFQYSVRNTYTDHLGAWGATKNEEGDSLTVFPNPTENDVG